MRKERNGRNNFTVLHLIKHMGNFMSLFFTHQGQAFPAHKFVLVGGSPEIVLSLSNTLFSSLFGEERPSNMLVLLSVLVFLLHLWGGLWLLSPNEQTIIPAKPLMMEVSMLTMSTPKPSVSPQPPAPPQTVKKPEQIMPQVKPIPKKLPPIVKKAPDAASAEKFVEQQSTSPSSTLASQASTASVSKFEAATNNAEPFTEANFRANYASNPKPDYPAIAKSRDWQGKVMLRVQVSAEGLSDSVRVEKSSGHEMLDECAVDAVKRWRFIPAKRGETPVASSVLVPINFSLTD